MAELGSHKDCSTLPNQHLHPFAARWQEKLMVPLNVQKGEKDNSYQTELNVRNKVSCEEWIESTKEEPMIRQPALK